jgi:hypothetical protein
VDGSRAAVAGEGRQIERKAHLLGKHSVLFRGVPQVSYDIQSLPPISSVFIPSCPMGAAVDGVEHCTCAEFVVVVSCSAFHNRSAH